MIAPLKLPGLAGLALAILILCAGAANAAPAAAAPDKAVQPPAAVDPGKGGGTSASGQGQAKRSYAPAAAMTTGADHGSYTYTARVIHNDRKYMSYVKGNIDLASGDFFEEITQSYILDFKVMPGKLEAAPQAMPSVWQVAGRPAQRFGSATDANSLPSFGSSLLRHFIIGQVIGAPQSIKAGTCYIAQQLEIDTISLDDTGFEIVGRYRGGPLVLVGSRQLVNGRRVPRDMAILGPTGELYQYFFEDFHYSDAALNPPVALPQFNSADYVSFPEGEAQAVAIRPVKDWLVFQASLPSGRQLNLLLDSGADTMIVDDLVLELDAGLTASGDTTMEGAVASSRMKLYKGFSFNVGGVEFRNLPVVGGTITNIAFGAGMRIHGVVGSEVLQLCRLDLDLDKGQMRLLPASAAPPAGNPLPLTFINDFPHVEAEVAGKGKALMLLDTGQRSPVSVNLDALQDYKLDDSLVMDGFLGDIGGSLLPRYMLEKLDVTLGGQTFEEKTVDAAPEGTYHYNGVPVIGSIGFSLLARHYGGVTFDYHNKYLYLRDPSQQREFKTSTEAWTAWQTKHYDPARLAKNLADETQKTGYELLAAELAETAAAAAPPRDPVEALLADAGLADPAQQEPTAGAVDSSSAAQQQDNSGPAASGPADPGAPAFRLEAREPKAADSSTAALDPAAEETAPGAEDSAGLGRGSRPPGEVLPPMTLKKTSRRLQGSDAVAMSGAGLNSGELWGALSGPAQLNRAGEIGPDKEPPAWLAGLRSAGAILAGALRAALRP
ncbi:hypothetical protein IT575_01755 [bacterium]|nr:hypothetical protein [bacterium]